MLGTKAVSWLTKGSKLSITGNVHAVQRLCAAPIRSFLPARKWRIHPAAGIACQHSSTNHDVRRHKLWAEHKALGWAGAGIATVLASAYIYASDVAHAEEESFTSDPNAVYRRPQKENVPHDDSKKLSARAGTFIPDLPVFSLEDVKKHNSVENQVWVIYKDGVYDVTTFIEQHPGGAKILLAAGGSIEPFWRLYAAHNHDDVRELLEIHRIGNLNPKDKEKLAMPPNATGPYANDPQRHPALVINSKEPFNAEPPSDLLLDRYTTPNDVFFVRNHLPVPLVDPKTYKLTIEGEGIQKPISLSLEDIKSKFKHHQITTTIQCAGNRRREMSKSRHVKGLSWNLSAISTATWTGVYLRDVLEYAGFDPETPGVRHIQFEGLDKEVDGSPYGGSIPIEKALNPYGDVLLAFQMNGEDIPRDHGYPIRAIVPGTVGARNVKWVSKVVPSKVESSSFWQQKDYRGFPPGLDYSNVDFSKAGPAIQELPVQSAIVEPRDGITIDDDDESITVRGYAWSGGGRGIVRVDVSIDGGKTWHIADLSKPVHQKPGRSWAWTLFEIEVPLPEEHPQNDEFDIVCKAVDDSYNNQPDTIEPIWNMRGMLNNSWHHVKVHAPTSLRRIYRRPSLREQLQKSVSK